jgi:hypothetical protein
MVPIGSPFALTHWIPSSPVVYFLISGSNPIFLMMSTAELRMSTLAPVKRRAGARSTMVILAFSYARRSQKAKTLPAMPEPEMQTLSGRDMIWFCLQRLILCKIPLGVLIELVGSMKASEDRENETSLYISSPQQ